jgi:1,4-alpha-glucan branching enzyme
LFRLLVKITERLVVVKADKIIMVSKKGMCEYHEIYNKYKDKIIYIPNGINIDKFIPIPNRNMTRYDFGIPYDQKVILYTGRFVKEKGIYLILKSFERVCRNITNCMLIFVGNGPLITEIQKYSAIYSNIKILLKVANDQMPYIYNTADTLVMGSYYEGWSNTLGEALACGVPVVTTNVGDAEELIYEGKNGYISYTRDPAEFANKCMLCLQNSDSMRKHARKSISAYSLENMANQLKNVYNELSRC